MSLVPPEKLCPAAEPTVKRGASSKLGEILNRLLIGGTWQTSSAVVNRLLPNLLVLVLAALVRPEELGAYSYILACYTVLSLFADLGIAYSLQKFIPENPQAAASIASTSLVVRFVSSVALGVLCLGLDLGLGAFKGYGGYILLLLASSSLGIPVYVLNARLRYRDVALFVIARSVLWFSLAVALVKMGRPVTGPIFSLALSFIVMGVLILWSRRSYFALRFEGRYAREIAKFGIWIMLASTFSLLITQAGILVMAYLAPESELGVYRLASTLGMAPMILGDALILPLLPLIKKSLKETPEEVPELIRLLIRYLFVVSLFFLGAGVVLIKPLVSLLFHPSYLRAVWPARLLLAASCPGLLFTVLISISYMSDDLKFGTRLCAAVAAISIALSLLWTRSRGAQGPAMALIVAYVAGMVVMAGWLSSRFRVRLEWRKYGVYLLSLAEMVGVLFAVSSRLPAPLARLLAGIILAPLIYALALILQRGVSKQEIVRILEIARLKA